MEKVFAAIDLKSFYASVECNERGLDPLTTNLVVADASRTDKTICLAVSPSLKSYGISRRARLFQVNSKVREVNMLRKTKAPLGIFLGKSANNEKLQKNPNLALDFIIATPRMQYYLNYSSKIYNIYLRHLAPEDIFAYSIDEVFCDLTSYLKTSKLSPADFVTHIITEVEQETGITATAGIGSNMFLAKVAMDILAKHTEPNSAGVRIAELNEISFREKLWHHQPITDFWRIGRGYAKRLAAHDMYTMGDIARCSIENEDLLYSLFGVNAELLIDHSWGWECVGIKDVKQHRPEHQSLSSGQVLAEPYTFQKAETIIKEMSESLSLELVQKGLVTNHIVLVIEYDRENRSQTSVIDRYNRRVPKPAQGTLILNQYTASTKGITAGFLELYHTKTNPSFTIRKITIAANNLLPEFAATNLKPNLTQTNFFTNYAELEKQTLIDRENQRKEKQVQQAILKIRARYGKNAILRGINFEDGATGKNRHRQIGGHRA